MRTFVRDIIRAAGVSLPVTSSYDSLAHGVTIIRSSEWWVTDAISSLIIDALGRDQVIADRLESISAGRGKVALFVHQGNVSVDDHIESALAQDIAVVIVDEKIPAWVEDICGRDVAIPEHLSDAQLARVLSLVCQLTDEIADVSGLGESLRLVDLIKVVRRGFQAPFIAKRMRHVVDCRQRVVAEVEASAFTEFARDLDAYGDKPKPKQVIRIVQQLSGG